MLLIVVVLLELVATSVSEFVKTAIELVNDNFLSVFACFLLSLSQQSSDFQLHDFNVEWTAIKLEVN